jgi:hypothetical protein
MRSSLLLLHGVLLLPGCPGPVDTGPASRPPADLTERLGADQARAGELSEADLGAFVGGTSGEAQAGDWLLYNDRARFVIRGLREGHWYVGEPGSLIDLDIVRPPGQPDRDGLDELLTMVGFGRLFVAEHIELISDGQDGGPAIVQATGTDSAIPYVEGMLELPGLFEPNGVSITQTFVLEPGSPALEITTTVHNTSDDDLVLEVIDAGMTDVATHRPFVPGAGFAGEAPDGARSMLAMASRFDDQAWALYRADGDMSEGLAGLGEGLDMLLAQGDRLELDEGERGSSTRLVAVAADPASLETHRRSLQGLASARVSGVVTEAGSGEGVAGARVFLADAAGAPWTYAVTDAQGAWSISAAPGDWQLVVTGEGSNEWMGLPGGAGSYGVYAHSSANEIALAGFADPQAVDPAPQADGHGRSEPVAVSLVEGEPVEQALELPQRAWLELTVVDEHGQARPAVVHLGFAEGAADPQPPEAALGESRPRGDVRKTVWVRDEPALVPLPPGRYDLVAHAGFRYEIDRAEAVEVAAGRTEAVRLVLERSVEHQGWVSMDPHVHASPSLDGGLTIEERLVTVQANDLQVHVSTDHDHVTDYRPVARAMGLEGWAITIPGDEISPTVRGHHNIYPVDPDPDGRSGGTPRWWEETMTTSELYQAWHERVGDDGVLQVNHGREGSGMFTAAEYDPETGTAGEPDYFGTAFDTMELLNSKGFGDATLLMRDWCSLMDQGHRPVAVGVSDSHTRLPGAGFPRTLVRLDVDAVTDADVPALIAALKAGRAQVSGGPVILFEAHDGDDIAGLGETLVSDRPSFSIEVLAPSWAPVERVELYGPGCQLLEQWAVDPAEVEPPRWFAAEHPLELEEAGYFFVLATGSGDLGPAWPGAHPYAMTNPIWVELPD